MEISIGKVVGRMEGGVWGQIHDFTPEDEGKLIHKGRMLAVVSREGEDAEPLQVVEEGREILARLHELYFGGMEVGLLGVKNAVEQLGEEFPEVEAEVLVIKEDVAYVVVRGGGGVWVKSGEQEGWIVKPGSALGVVGLSGKVGSEKIVVAGNEKWWKKVTLGQIKMAAEGEDFEGGLEMLAAAIHAGEEAEGEVGAIVKFETLNPKLQNREETKISEPEVKTKKLKFSWPKISFKKKEEAVYVKFEDKGSRRKRTRIIAAGFAVLLLVIGLWGRIKMQNQNKKNDENNKLVEDMVYKFREAKGVAELNPARSRQLIPTVTDELATLEQRKVNDSRIAEVKDGLPDVLALATGTKKVELKEIMDLGLVRDGMAGNGMTVSDGKLIIADKTADRIAVVDPVKASGKILAGKEGVGETQLVAGYPGKVEIFSDKGIVECLVDETKCSTKIAKDQSWGNIVDMKMFAGNVYLLDSATGDIWRYQGAGGNFGKKQTWLADDTAKSAVKFGKSMTIDGSVWVAGGDGSLLKITQGVKEEITVSGWDKPWGQNVIIYSDDTMEKLYVLDADNGRLVIVKKNGEYEMQLVAEGFRTAEGLVVDEGDKKAYIVGGGKIWEADW